MLSETTCPDLIGKSRLAGKNTKTIRSLLYSILTIIVLIFAQNVSYAQIQTNSFVFDGTMRNYTVFLPQNYQPNIPVVLNLHGRNSPLQLYMDLLMMNEFADTAGFIVVYPVGIDLAWNSGGDGNRPNIDDVGFISALIDTLYTHYNIDMARIYCTGYSNGAMMTYRLAAELGHRFAAVAPIAGNLSDIAVDWNPIRPMPIINFHGTADMQVPYNGSPHNWSVVETLNFWVQNNNCSLTADTILLPDIDTLDNSTVEKISWTDCSNNSNIIHYKIINGGHTWPGATPYPGIGETNNDINANVEMWNFFQNYENPLVNMAWAKTVEVSRGYLDPQGDTLFLKVNITNPENHLVSVYAKIYGEGVSFSDSLMLYDDGMHGDEDLNDNIWGNAELLSGLKEDLYKVEILTHDISFGTIHKYHLLNYFTTIGPVVFDNYEIPQWIDTVFTIKYSLRNDGFTATATTVTAILSTTDTSVTNIQGTSHFGDIAPGEVKSQVSFSIAIYHQNNPDSIEFIVNIYSNGRFFWSDSFTVSVPIIPSAENETNVPIEYALKQNYPNPFNPSTKIKYSIPQSSNVVIKVFDILGNEIATLVNEEKPIGIYEVQFDATGTSSGLYFYQLQAGNFVETKKLVLMK